MKRPWTKVTLPMRRRMRELRAAGLGAEAIARVIQIDFDLPAPPSRDCIDAHAPRQPHAPSHGLMKGRVAA